MKTPPTKFGLLARQVVVDEAGGEVIEWVMIGGLIVVATIATVSSFGTKVLAKWTSINSSM